MAEQFSKNGQTAWFHDEGDEYGFFHTYDALRLPGPDGAARKIHVFVPREYERSAERYRVYYCNDGHTAFFRGGIGNQSWRMADVLAALLPEMGNKKILAVAICPVDRNREYTHVRWTGIADGGGLDAYARYVAGQVRPFIDATYRTIPEDAMIAGSSHGGLAAFYAGILHRPAFSMIAALSPSFWAGLDDAGCFPRVLPVPENRLGDSELILALDRRLAGKPHPRIFLDWGMMRSGGHHNSHVELRTEHRAKEMIGLLTGRYGFVAGKDLFFREIPDGEHTENSWHSRIGAALRIWLRLDSSGSLPGKFSRSGFIF